MKRAIWMALVVFAVAGAGPQAAMPIPPIPPAHPPTDSLAPMPDLDAYAPAPDASASPEVRLQDFRVQEFDHSLGYVPGSHFATSEDKRPIQTPGLTVRVPLQ